MFVDVLLSHGQGRTWLFCQERAAQVPTGAGVSPHAAMVVSFSLSGFLSFLYILLGDEKMERKIS
jgi:hypothetical protein